VSGEPRTEDARPPFGRGLPGNHWDLLDGVWPDPLPTVSVIVAHYRQQAELDRTLAALGGQTYPAALLEIVVVDDGSPERPRVPAGVVLVVQPDEGFRLAAARNLGVKSSTGDVLCFLDADTAPEPDYVARLTRLPALAPETVAVGRRRHATLAGIPVDAPLDLTAPAFELPEPRWIVDAYGWYRDLLDSDDRSYRYLIGAVTACTRWFFDEVGGFDETFREYGGEDWEWAYRAWVEGAVFAHVSDAVAWHDGPEWSGRGETEADRRRQKNDETFRMTDVVPVGGSRGRAVRTRRPDVVVRLTGAVQAGAVQAGAVQAGAVQAGAVSLAAAFICVDTILDILPGALVVVPDAVLGAFRWDARVVGASSPTATLSPPPRVVVEAAAAVRVERPGADARAVLDLATAVATVGVGTLGSVVFTSVDGDAVLTVTSHRQDARHRHWGTDDLFTTEHLTVPWLTPVDGEPGLAAYLGGWG